MLNQLAYLYLSIKEFVKPVLRKFSSPETLEYLFYRYGWDISIDGTAFDKINQALSIKADLEQFLLIAGKLQQKLDDAPESNPSLEEIKELVQSGSSLIEALVDFKLSNFDGLLTPLDSQDFWKSIGEHLFDDLLEEYVRIYHPNVYLLLHCGGVIRYESTQPVDPFRRAYTRIVFDWTQGGELIKDPLTALKQTYHWGDPDTPFEHQRFLEALGNVLHAIHLSTKPFAPILRSKSLPDDVRYQIKSDVDALSVTFLGGYSLRDRIFYEIGLELYAAAKTGESIPSGLILSPKLRGGVTLP